MEEKTNRFTDDPLLRLYAEFGRSNVGYGVVGVVGTVVSHLLGLLPAFVVGLTVDAVFLDGRPYELPGVPSAWIPTEPLSQLILSIGVLVCAALLGAGASWVQNWGWNRFAQRVQHALRVATYERLQSLDLPFFEERRTGELVSVLSNDVNQLESFLNDGVSGALRILVVVVGIGVIMVGLNPQLALVALVSIPVLALFTARFTRPSSRSTLGYARASARSTPDWRTTSAGWRPS